MSSIGRASLAAVAVVAALVVPAAASAAPTVVATSAPGTPQDCQAGCITSIRVACTAADPLSVLTTVRCWTRSYNVWSNWQTAPVAAATATTYSPLSFTLCVEGTSRYADGTTASSGVVCGQGDAGVALVTNAIS